MPVSLSDDATARALASIRRYFTEQREQELGELQARLLLEFVLKEIVACSSRDAESGPQCPRLADPRGRGKLRSGR